MIDGPTGTFGQFCHHVVAVAEECDVEVDVVGWFARNVNLWHFFVDIVGTVNVLISVLKLRRRKKEDSHFGDRGDFHGCADDDYQVDYGGVVLCEAIEKAAGKLLAKERDVGLGTLVWVYSRETDLNSPSSRQAEGHRSVHHLQSRSGLILTWTCHWTYAYVYEVVYR